MAKLSAAARKNLPKSKFAFPAQRKYPVEDQAHASNAKSRAQHQYEAGQLSKAERDKIFAKANKVLGKSK